MKELELFGQLVSGSVSGFSIGNFFIPTHTVIPVLTLGIISSYILSLLLSLFLVNYILNYEYKKAEKILKILAILIAFAFVSNVVLLLLAK